MNQENELAARASFFYARTTSCYQPLFTRCSCEVWALVVVESPDFASCSRSAGMELETTAPVTICACV